MTIDNDRGKVIKERRQMNNSGDNYSCNEINII